MLAVLLCAVTFASACSTSSGTDASHEIERETDALAAQESASRDADPAPMLALVGNYRHAGGEAEQAALEAAVEDVVQEMNVLTRGIARKRLLAANRIPASLTITTSGDRVTIEMDDRRYTATLDGGAVDVVGVTGDALRMTLRMRGAKLVQHFVGELGERTNTVRRTAESVVMQVVIASDSLPKKLVYELTYSAMG